MIQSHKYSLFTPEQMDILAANKFTAKVNRRQIIFKLEFKNLFLSRYEQGYTSVEIFESCGYDPKILGRNRIYGFARRLRELVESGRPLTEDYSKALAKAPVNIDYNTMPSQLSVSAMQRELIYLRQQVEFLKKITVLDNERKPRN
ncbi:MAG: hypothetical protein IJI57_05585 [Flexilinea sp.]|nr:hypothetical protein [Flexilinea sp.]